MIQSINYTCIPSQNTQIKQSFNQFILFFMLIFKNIKTERLYTVQTQILLIFTIFHNLMIKVNFKKIFPEILHLLGQGVEDLYLYLYRSKMKIYCLLLLFTVASAKILVPLHQESPLLSDSILLKDPYILVEASSSELHTDDFDLAYKKLVVLGKSKRQSYDHFRRKYKEIVASLVSQGAIPNKEAMIHSPIQMNFLKHKRKWEFSRVFVVYSHRDESSRILNALHHFGLFDLKSRPLIGYLNEKFVSIMAFIKAKKELESYLREFLHSSLQIIEVKDIQIVGRKLSNQEGIESDLKEQYNFSEPPIVEGHLKENKFASQKYLSKILQQTVTIKVMFKIGRKQEKGHRNKGQPLSEHSISQFEVQELGEIIEETLQQSGKEEQFETPQEQQGQQIDEEL